MTVSSTTYKLYVGVRVVFKQYFVVVLWIIIVQLKENGCQKCWSLNEYLLTKLFRILSRHTYGEREGKRAHNLYSDSHIMLYMKREKYREW